MPPFLLSKYEHQFELDLVNEAVEHEIDELKELKERHKKAWGIPVPIPPEKKKARSVADKFRAAVDKGKKPMVDEMESTGMGKVWMTRRRADGRVSDLLATQCFLKSIVLTQSLGFPCAGV